MVALMSCVLGSFLDWAPDSGQQVTEVEALEVVKETSGGANKRPSWEINILTARLQTGQARLIS